MISITRTHRGTEFVWANIESILESGLGHDWHRKMSLSNQPKHLSAVDSGNNNIPLLFGRNFRGGVPNDI